jgi:primase-polymerase (primpol)-like protein
MQPHPKTHCGNLTDPPAALAPLVLKDQWLVWKWMRSSNGHGWTKPPFCADHPSQHAASNNPETWATYTTAVRAVTSGQAHGIGFALTGTTIGAVDLDHCRNPETGAIDSWAQEILASAPDAYHEVTVSGCGLRVIGIATGAAQHKRFPVTGRLDGAVEVYRQAVRYITISGLEISKCTSLPNIDGLIDNLVVRYEKSAASGAYTFEKKDQKKREELRPEWSEQEEARVRAALKFVSAVERQTWLHVGMALHWTGWGDKARLIWDDWSQTVPDKHDEGDQ